MDENMIDFDNLLHLNGYKMTAQRRVILKIILNEKKKHLCTEEILSEAKKIYPKIGLATVYRTLQLFEKLGFIDHISLNDGRMRFQIMDSRGKHHHHHLICEICGEIIDVKEDMLESVEKKLLSEMEFTVKDHKVQFFGICKKCAERIDEKNGGK
jgi:Fur family ferric uptake transcriptional regulator